MPTSPIQEDQSIVPQEIEHPNKELDPALKPIQEQIAHLNEGRLILINAQLDGLGNKCEVIEGDLEDGKVKHRLNEQERNLNILVEAKGIILGPEQDHTLRVKSGKVSELSTHTVETARTLKSMLPVVKDAEITQRVLNGRVVEHLLQRLGQASDIEEARLILKAVMVQLPNGILNSDELMAANGWDNLIFVGNDLDIDIKTLIDTQSDVASYVRFLRIRSQQEFGPGVQPTLNATAHIVNNFGLTEQIISQELSRHREGIQEALGKISKTSARGSVNNPELALEMAKIEKEIEKWITQKFRESEN